MGAEASKQIPEVGNCVQCCANPETGVGSEVQFDEDSVLIFDILGCRVYSDKKPKSRYVFLLPGRLIHTSKTKNAKEAFAAAVEEYSTRGTGLDISVATQVEVLDSTRLRLYNLTATEDDNVDPSLVSEHRPSSPGSTPRREGSVYSDAHLSAFTTSMDNISYSDHENDETWDLSKEEAELFRGIHRKDLPSAIIIRFMSPEDMKPWITLIEIEKKKTHFPQSLFSPPVNEEFIAAFNLAMAEIFEMSARNTPLKSFIFECRMPNGPGEIFRYLYYFFFSLVISDDPVDSAVSFVSFLDIVVSDTATAVIILGFYFGPEIVKDLSSKISELSTRFRDLSAPATASGSASGGAGGNGNGNGNAGGDKTGKNISESGGKLRSHIILNLVSYISEKVRKVKWSKNRPILCDVFGYPYGSSLHSKKVIAWFRELKKMEGRFKDPFVAEWEHLRLLVEPTPYCGYYFLDQYVTRGQVDYARELSGILPYKATVTFTALRTIIVDADQNGPDANGDGEKDDVQSDDLSDIDLSIFGDTQSSADKIPPSSSSSDEMKVPAEWEQFAEPPELKSIVKEVRGAHFIEFLEWELVQRAYEDFQWINGENERISALLGDSKRVYNAPLVTSMRVTGEESTAKAWGADSAAAAASAGEKENEKEEEGDLDDEISQTPDELLRTYTHQLRRATKLNERKRNPTLCLVKDLYLKWIVFMQNNAVKLRQLRIPEAKTMKALLQPNHFISVLVLAFLAEGKCPSLLSPSQSPHASSDSHADDRNPSSSSSSSRIRGKAVIAQLEPTEDRAIMLAMTAAYVVKRTKKRVHILYHSEAKMNDDFIRMAGYYTLLGVSTSLNDFLTSASVTYCVQSELCQFYRYNAFRGKDPLGNTVLLVNDIDKERIVSEPLTVFAKKDEQLSKPMKVYFDLFLQVGDEATPPSEVTGPMVKLAWERAREAYEQYEKMVENEPHGYAQASNGRYYKLDSKGRMDRNKTSLGLDMVRYQYGDEQPLVQSVFFFQSVPHILSQYEYAVCFGAALTMEDEPAVLNNRICVQSMLHAWNFNIPVEKTRHHQWRGKRLSMLTLKSAAAAAAAKIPTAFDLKTSSNGGAGNWLTTELTSIFDRNDPNGLRNGLRSGHGNASVHSGVGSESTSVGPSGSASVSVSTNLPPHHPHFTPWKDANSNGTAIGPANGTPNGNGNATGKNAVNISLMPVTNGSPGTAQNRATMADSMMSVSDAMTDAFSQSQLQAQSLLRSSAGALLGASSASGKDNDAFGLLTIEKGRMMNQLCQRFYKKYPYEGGMWPDKPSHRKLIEFLNDEKLHTMDGVGAFAVSMRLAKSPEEYFGEATV